MAAAVCAAAIKGVSSTDRAYAPVRDRVVVGADGAAVRDTSIVNCLDIVPPGESLVVGLVLDSGEGTLTDFNSSHLDFLLQK